MSDSHTNEQYSSLHRLIFSGALRYQPRIILENASSNELIKMTFLRRLKILRKFGRTMNNKWL